MVEHEPTMSGTKVCSKCGEEKHVLCFSRAAKNKDGLKGACRDCLRAQDRDRYLRNKKRFDFDFF